MSDYTSFIKKSILVVVLSAAACFLTPGKVFAADPPQPSALCLPGVYLTDPGDCLPIGPSAARMEQAKQGMPLPLRPLPAVQAPAALGAVPFSYALLPKGTDTPVFSSLDDARADQNPAYYIQPGDLRYISYADVAYDEGSSEPDYFMLREGGWVAGRDVATRVGGTNRFQGLVFRRTPERPFGWIMPLVSDLRAKAEPGYNAPESDAPLMYPYQVVQVYAVQIANNVDWYLVGPGQWVEGRMVARVLPNPTPPEGVTGNRWIEVNLYEQTLAVYENNQLTFATMIASGMDPFFTRPGVFQIYRKLESTPMSGAFAADRSDFYYLQDVPWTLYYDQARALHAAYWRTRFGYQQSHGCVNLSPGDAHWVFDWAQVGDWVYVWDPSGETPTDPKYYGDGGA